METELPNKMNLILWFSGLNCGVFPLLWYIFGLKKKKMYVANLNNDKRKEDA